MQTLPIKFHWSTLEPTPVPYWKAILDVDYEIVVELPLKPEFIHNFEAISAQGMVNNQKTEQPILTVKGYKYCINQLQDNEYNEFEDKFDTDDDGFEPRGIDDTDFE